MKHLAFLGTCAGLMTLAAVFGINDLVHANREGTLKHLYEETPVPVTGELDFEDYSRAAPDYHEPPVPIEPESPGDVEAPPPPLPPKQPKQPKVIVEALTAPAIDTAVFQLDTSTVPEAPAPPATPIPDSTVINISPEVKEVSYRYFSRAPLPVKKIKAKKKLKE